MQTINTNNEILYVLTRNEYSNLTNDELLDLRTIAKMWGMSINHLSECPWLLPPHTKGKRNQKYLKSEINRLMAIGRDELKRCYEQGITV